MTLARPSGAEAADPCAAGEACVVVTWEGTVSGSRVVSIDDITNAADLTTTTYPVRRTPGGPTSDERIGSPVLSMRGLAGLVGLTQQQVSFTQTTNPLGLPSLLDHDDLLQPTDPGFPFQNGLMPAIYVNGGKDSIGYIRPLRGPNDVNGGDYFQTDSDSPLVVTFHTTGSPLTPTLTVADATTTVGKADAFTVTVAGGMPPGPTFDWYFGDGPDSTNANATTEHAFTAAGTYNAYVVVTGSDGSIGVSNAVKVTVGKPPPKPPGKPNPGGGTHHHHHPPTSGPTHSHGSHAGAAPSTTAGQGSGSKGPKGSTGPTTKAPAKGHVDDADLQLVSGVVIGATAALSPQAGASSQTAVTAPAARQGARSTGAAAAGGGLAVALLMGCGALSETRWRRRRTRASRVTP